MEGFQDSVVLSEIGVTCTTGLCLTHDGKSVNKELWAKKLEEQCTGSRLEDGLTFRDQKQKD